MKKHLILILFLIIFTTVKAQVKIYSGKVLDGTNIPVSNAKIKILETGKETTSTKTGTFSIEAKKGQSLFVENQEKESQQIKLTDQTLITIQLGLKIQELDGVVITALGVKREKKSLGYSSQKLDGSQVNTTPTNNFLNNLSGKVAGLEIRNNNNFGGSVNVVLRGSRSLTGNNQALIVVDGVPVNNSTQNNTVGSLDFSITGKQSYDFGNGAGDLDPNNIESVNILKGAAATALYGSQASNGAIMITTKRGKKNQALNVTLNTNVSIGNYDKSTFAKYQKTYGQGYEGEGSSFIKDVVNTKLDASYGSAYDPKIMVYQWDSFYLGSKNYNKKTAWLAAKNDPNAFFQTAISNTNSINLNGGDDKNTYNLGFNNSKDLGVLPNSLINKNIFSGNFSRDFSEKLKATTFLSFTNQYTVGRNKLASSDNFLMGFRQWWATNADVLELKEAYFNTKKNINWNMKDPANGNINSAYFNNPYFDRYENYTEDTRRRFLTGVNLSYDINKNFNILGRAGVDYSNNQQKLRKAIGSISKVFGISKERVSSGYEEFNATIFQQSYDLIATYNTKIAKNIDAKFLGGYSFLKRTNDQIDQSTTGGLFQEKQYALSVSNVFIAPLESLVNYEKSGFYAQASFDFYKQIFVEGTVRSDKTSALLVNNQYTYPSVGVSWLFSDLVNQKNILNFGKVRFSYAVVGNDPEPGQLGVMINKGKVNNLLIYSNSDTYVDYDELKAEKINTLETGLELAFFKNRLTLDASLYQSTSVDMLFRVPVSAASTYKYEFTNAGKMRNRGVELSLGIIPIRTQNFTWNMNINWSKNQNKIIELDSGRDNLQLADFGSVSLNASVGQPYGTIRGSDFVYHNGQRVVDAEKGTYLRQENQVLGTIQANWMGGISNKFSYKNISFGFLIDVKKGGSVFSDDLYYGMSTGVYPETAGLNDLGNPIRNNLNNTSPGGVVLQGVKEGSFAPNNIRISAFENGGSTAFSTDMLPAKAYVYDASYVKLREASFTYSLPQKVFANSFVKGVSLSVLGSNLWIIHKNLPYADPESGIGAGNIQGYQSGVMPTVKTYSFNVKVNL